MTQYSVWEDQHFVDESHGRGGMNVQIFADDTFGAARSPAVYQFTDILVPVHFEIYSWTTECNMKFSYGKYNHIAVNPQKKAEEQILVSYPHGRQ